MTHHKQLIIFVIILLCDVGQFCHLWMNTWIQLGMSSSEWIKHPRIVFPVSTTSKKRGNLKCGQDILPSTLSQIILGSGFKSLGLLNYIDAPSKIGGIYTCMSEEILSDVVHILVLLVYLHHYILLRGLHGSTVYKPNKNITAIFILELHYWEMRACTRGCFL